MMSSEVTPPMAPMEAELVKSLPRGDQWLYEPKWDGFRCLIFADENQISLFSKSQKPLGRYFPELLAAVKDLKARRLVLDGEIVIPKKGRLSFDDLLQRIHPAQSRVEKLSREFPALVIVFDLLVDDEGKDLLLLPFRERRARLSSFAGKFFQEPGAFRLSPCTPDFDRAEEWLGGGREGLDGVIAKRADLPYLSGERRGMRKVKFYRSADCVVGGFRYASKDPVVGSLLLGLFDEDGLLHHVGYTSGLRKGEKKELTRRLEKIIEPPGFTGRAPGGPSRWSTERSGEWKPLRTELVVEVIYDHFSSHRFRHGTRLHRWRPDKDPGQCTFDQIQSSGGSLSLIEKATE